VRLELLTDHLRDREEIVVSRLQSQVSHPSLAP